MWSIVILIGGLASILLGANLLVDGAGSLAKRFNVSNLVIGLTVVAFGTSTPELAVSVYSGMTGQPDMAIGNVVGSNIFNVMVILGLTALVLPIQVQTSTVFKEIPFAMLGALLLFAGVNDPWIDGTQPAVLSRIDSIFLLGFFAIFMYYIFELTKKQESLEVEPAIQQRPLWLSVLLVTGGLALLVAGGRWTVDGAVDIAAMLQIDPAVVALTIVATGTSLPELATSIVAALKGNSDMAVGNVVGSCIFNIFMILGIAGVVHPLTLGNIDNVDLIVCVVSGIALQIFAINHKISRWEGGLLFLLYCAYIGFLLW